MYDAICMGEVLIDLIPGKDNHYAARVGGAPANVAVGLAHAGRTVSMLSRVGKDWLGSTIQETLAEHGVVTDHLAATSEATAVAVVAPSGKFPDFILYREGTADSSMVLSLADRLALTETRLLHIGSLLPTSAAGRLAMSEAVKIARETGALVSTDVNLRPSAWATQDLMIAETRKLIDLADIVKVTRTELHTLGLEFSDLEVTGKLWFITDGHRGATIIHGLTAVTREVEVVEAVDTTGAGDASLAALLSVVLDHTRGIAVPWEETEYRLALAKSAVAGAEAVQRVGALPDVPGNRNFHQRSR
jgi:fructokinase